MLFLYRKGNSYAVYESTNSHPTNVLLWLSTVDIAYGAASKTNLA